MKAPSVKAVRLCDLYEGFLPSNGLDPGVQTRWTRNTRPPPPTSRARAPCRLDP